MTVQLTKLENGLRVVTQEMPHLHSAAIGVWVGVGARDECDAEHGICHLLEHMAFKGTVTRSARQIAEEIEQVGGDMNAATGLEMTAYYVRLLKEDVPLGLGVLADILQNSTFDPDELTLEKDVILQEIAAVEDAPEEIAYDLALAAAFSGQSVGRPILGTPESVTAIKSEDLKSHLVNRYTPESMIICATGAVDHAAIVSLVQQEFQALKPKKNRDTPKARFTGGAKVSGKAFEQCHLVAGFSGPSYRDEGFMEAQVFSGLLGGGMSSRLFQEAREKRGLCYTIYSSSWGLRDSGIFSIYAATGQQMLPKLTDVIVGEIRKCADGGLSEQEVSRSKAQLRAGLLMSLESAPARAEQIARQLLLFGRIIETEELIARIDNVSAAGLSAFAIGLLEQKRPAVAVVGAGKDAQKLADRTMHAFAA